MNRSSSDLPSAPFVVRNISASCIAAGILAVLPTLSQAQLPHSRLSSVFPPGGKAGSEVEVATAGADLTEGKALLFSNAKIVGKAIEGQANKFKVTIAPDVAPGVYDAWFVGKYGVSTSRAFVVGSRKESSESGAHASLTTAAAIEPGTIVNGRAEAGSADYFKFKAAKGQRILVECESNRIDSRMEASLVLFDMDAAELGRSRNRGMIDFEAPADGEYVVKVHDFQFRGGADYFYRDRKSTV